MKMLQKINALATFILVAMLFVACTEEEQTSMSIDDIQGRAKIVGNLSYSEGQSFENGRFVELIKPAANKKVTVEVANASLSPDAFVQGNTTFTGITDESGNYTIEIPVVAKSAGMEISIKPEAFVEERSLLKNMSTNAPEFEKKEVVFFCPAITRTVKPDDFIVADMRYGFTERNIETGFNETADLKVRVGLGKLREAGRLMNYNEPYIDLKSGVNAIVTVVYNEEEAGATLVRNYGGTTDSNGEFLLKIPVREKACTLQIQLKTIPFVENSFRFYTSSDYTSYSGLYEQSTTLDPMNITFYGIDGVENIIKSIMLFDQFEGQEAGYRLNDYNWSGLQF